MNWKKSLVSAWTRPLIVRARKCCSSCPRPTYFGTPHYYTFLGYLALFHEVGLDYTLSAYASEGGNFGLFTSHELMQRLNAKVYA